MRHHAKKVLLTTDRSTYERVRNLANGESIRIEFVYDIVSSFRGESVNHHTLRRTELLRRMLHGDFRKIAVRCEAGIAVDCLLVGYLKGETDGCSGQVVIGKVA